MKIKTIHVIFISTIIIFSIAIISKKSLFSNQKTQTVFTESTTNPSSTPTPTPHPMDIQLLRKGSYPGSNIVITQNLSEGSNYNRYIAYYISEGNKIYGLLTIPKDTSKKHPLIVFLHGYIPPKEYKTTQRYVAYQDQLASNNFITYKIDLRGHGNSEGQSVNGHFSEKYVIDTLNALSSLKQLSTADPEKIGIWGHSNGGEIGLRTSVVSDEIDAAVFWAGVVGSFEAMLETYNHKIPFLNIEKSIPDLVSSFKFPSENPSFWNKIDPYTYLSETNTAFQLHHATNDESVPVELSLELYNKLNKIGKIVEFYEYPNSDHNLSNPSFTPAMQRSIQFFKKHLSN